MHTSKNSSGCEEGQSHNRAFLEQFEPNRRGVIANYFYQPIRNGVNSPEGVVAAVAVKVRCQLDGQWLDDQRRQNYREVLDAVQVDLAGALAFAAECIRRENLPAGEREALREEGAEAGIRAWMAKQEPTERQIAFLRKRGCADTPDNRLEASDMIDSLMRAGR